MRNIRSSSWAGSGLLFLVACLAGCSTGNSSSGSSNNGGGGTTGTSGFVAPSSGDYLLQATNDISASTPEPGVYISTVNASTAALGSPVFAQTSDFVQGKMVVTPSNSFLYAATAGIDGIVGYRLVGPGLQLQVLELNGNPEEPRIPIPASPTSLVVHPSGNFLYVIAGPYYIQQFAINAQQGTLTAIAMQTESNTGLTDGVIDPLGHFLFVSDGNGRIFVYQIDQSTGILSPVAGSPFTVTSGGKPSQLALDPSGKFLYAMLYNSGSIAVLTVDSSTGALTTIAGSPFRTGFTANASMTLNAATDTLYVSSLSSLSSPSIAEFSINQSTGVPTPLTGSPLAVGIGDLTIDSDASVLFGTGYSNIAALSIASGTGALSSLPAAPSSGVSASDLYFVKIP